MEVKQKPVKNYSRKRRDQFDDFCKRCDLAGFLLQKIEWKGGKMMEKTLVLRELELAKIAVKEDEEGLLEVILRELLYAMDLEKELRKKGY